MVGQLYRYSSLSPSAKDLYGLVKQVPKEFLSPSDDRGKFKIYVAKILNSFKILLTCLGYTLPYCALVTRSLLFCCSMNLPLLMPYPIY